MGFSLEETVENLLKGDRRAAARLISMAENGEPAGREALKRIYPRTGRAPVLGITGPAGVGKSSLTDHVIQRFRAEGRKVGALLIDPSSPFSGGAFLGDRVRMGRHVMDDGIFIRSMATRGSQGGLARGAFPATRFIEAMGSDIVIVETVGVGQDEIDVMDIAHTCVLVLSPAMGDDIQTMKAGVLEIANVIAFNKMDLEGAEARLGALQAALQAGVSRDGGWRPRVIPTVAHAGDGARVQGIDELMEAIAEHQGRLRESGGMERLRAQRALRELRLVFRERVERRFQEALDGGGMENELIASLVEGKVDPYSIADGLLDAWTGACEAKAAP